MQVCSVSVPLWFGGQGNGTMERRVRAEGSCISFKSGAQKPGMQHSPMTSLSFSFQSGRVEVTSEVILEVRNWMTEVTEPGSRDHPPKGLRRLSNSEGFIFSLRLPPEAEKLIGLRLDRTDCLHHRTY